MSRLIVYFVILRIDFPNCRLESLFLWLLRLSGSNSYFFTSRNPINFISQDDSFKSTCERIVFFNLQAICTEAGLLALRERRMKVKDEDFKKAKENVLYRKNEGTPEGLYL